MKETLRGRIRQFLASHPDQTYRQLIAAMEQPDNSVRLAIAGLIYGGEAMSVAISNPSAGKKAERVTLRLTAEGRKALQTSSPKVRAVTSSSTSDTEGHGEEDAPNPYQGACVPTFVRGTASFTCERRGQQVTHADCYDDYLAAEAYVRKTSPCYRCALGAEKRAAYAEA